MNINLANYEFNFPTERGFVLFRRFRDNGMDMMVYENGDLCPRLVAFFETQEWDDFCVAFGGRFVKAGKGMDFDADPS